MYVFKLIDVILQGVAYLVALLLLIIHQADGYYYWITFGICGWIFVSIIINIFTLKPLSVLRIITSSAIGIAIIFFLISYLIDSYMGRLNFYFNIFSFFIIVGYFFLSLSELNQLKIKGDIDLDF